MNDDVKEYPEVSNKMKKSNEPLENNPECMKNLEEQLIKSLYQHLSTRNERNDGSGHSTSETSAVNNLNRNSDSTNGKPRNGDYSRASNRNSSYRNIYVSSSSEDDDEHCVYTYKGAELPNLPESVFNVVDVHNGRDGSLCSSPDMDYLEMDFDPGPSNDQDSDSDNASHDVPNIEGSDTFHENQQIVYVQESHCDENANCYVDKIQVEMPPVPQSINIASGPVFKQIPPDNEQPCCSKSLDCDRSNEVFKTNQYFSFGDSSDEEVPISDDDDVTFIVDGYHEDKRLDPDVILEIPYASIPEANCVEDNFCCFESLLTVDPTYSISAIVNLLTALNIPQNFHYTKYLLTKFLRKRRIHNNVPIIDYLILRAIEDVNETELVNFLSEVTEKKVHSRFFTTYPKRNVNYLEWMSHWMNKGALPMVTRNVLERGSLSVENIVYNQWRHNVVYKIESAHASLTNPLERIEESVLTRQLCQPPSIYIKRSTLMKKWHPKVDLTALLKPKDERWFNENVLGQLASMIREHTNFNRTKHFVRIPSNCQCGITLFASSDDLKLCAEINEASELPLA